MPRRHLSQRQKERIGKIQERRRQRLENRVTQTLDKDADQRPRPGRVIARHGANLAVEDESGKLFHCLSRQNLGHAVCGDRVVWQPIDSTNGVVIALQKRNTVLARPDYSGKEKPLAANITQLVIVLAVKPEPNEYLVDQYLVAAETIGLRCLITLNKVDLVDETERKKIHQHLEVYRKAGYPVIGSSAKREHGREPLAQYLGNQTSILVGQSGVGKSSLVKALLPDREIQTGRLSETTGLGRHTTSVTTCYRLPNGGELIDSPGVRSFRLSSLSKTELERGFVEFRPYLGKCKFSNCNHRQEPGCALKTGVAEGKIDSRRLRNLRHMADRLGHNRRSFSDN